MFYDIINYLKISSPFSLANENNQSEGEELIRSVNGQKEPKEGKEGVMGGCISFGGKYLK